jgi:hypothetical protein
MWVLLKAPSLPTRPNCSRRDQHGGINLDARVHWEKVYTTKAPDQVSWYRAHLETSLALIEQSARSRDDSIIDVGGGESTLVDDLWHADFRTLPSWMSQKSRST